MRVASILTVVLLSISCSNPFKGIAESKDCEALANATGKLDWQVKKFSTSNFAMYRNVCVVMMTWALPDGETNRTCTYSLGRPASCSIHPNVPE